MRKHVACRETFLILPHLIFDGNAETKAHAVCDTTLSDDRVKLNSWFKPAPLADHSEKLEVIALNNLPIWHDRPTGC